MRKFFIPNAAVGQQAAVTGEDHQYITEFLGLMPGDKLTVYDGHIDYMATVAAVHPSHTAVCVIEMIAAGSDPAIDITVFMALLPHGVLLPLIERLAEIGVKAIVPFKTECATFAYGDIKTELLCAAAGLAARRSGRSFAPPVYAAVEFNEMRTLLRDYPVKLFFYESEQRNDLKKHIKQFKREKKLAVIIGPPGGFTEKEAEKLRTLCGGALSLGRRLLKSDTAALVAVAAVLYEYGELGNKNNK